jgi:hypothetical protein
MAANRSKSVGQASSEVLEAAPGRMPKVRAPDSPVVFWGGLGGAVLAGLLVFIVANLAVGFLFSTIARNQLQAMQMSFFFMLPNILLSGYMFPREAMPDLARWIGLALVLGAAGVGVSLWPELSNTQLPGSRQRIEGLLSVAVSALSTFCVLYRAWAKAL